jgi:hypothetical protein
MYEYSVILDAPRRVLFLMLSQTGRGGRDEQSACLVYQYIPPNIPLRRPPRLALLEIRVVWGRRKVRSAASEGSLSSEHRSQSQCLRYSSCDLRLTLGTNWH